MSANESTRERLSQGVMGTGDGMRIFPDVEACIDCGGCVVACKRTWDVPVDDQRIDITTMLEGVEGESGFNSRQVSAIEEGMNPGETSLPMQCYHCENAPCVSVCPTNALQKKDNGFVEVVDDLCIGCQYCLSACPFGAPQFPESNEGLTAVVGSDGTMDKCTGCEERQDVGKGPACAEECATDAILVGSPGQIANELEKRDSGAFFNDTAMEIIFGDDAEMFER
ncbi:putative dimethyl sulfoxide reductase iron-sulfur subunit B [Halalkalicoccus paucihalophilus]|uniref:Putative dimethyl sulfoxide reductase iron-sulfur subunit B n=1 Tax=Halalkalicoccus paucihalophilus TaxID=1008153 RepID=A0A151AJZ0_9EURY|nr:4Fe-4S dicluster domain-containing protein [Halalkalicoccus paucihalophilus]KYH27885.1 putative dimethyl sulfoxide reductase iron-sulfur subunit B [Halalkalicoccus paucihalophilus]